MKRTLKRIANALGYDVSRRAYDQGCNRLDDVSAEVRATIERVRPFTMTSPERIAYRSQARLLFDLTESN